jgi:hypothetical protein
MLNHQTQKNAASEIAKVTGTIAAVSDIKSFAGSLPPCGGGLGWGVLTGTIFDFGAVVSCKVIAQNLPPPLTPPHKGEGNALRRQSIAPDRKKVQTFERDGERTLA